MPDEVITRAVHEEFVKRVDEHFDRVDARLKNLDDGNKEMQELTISVKELAVTMSGMVTEQKKQGEKLELLESRDGEKWRKAIWCIISSLIGLIVGYAFNIMTK